MSKKIKQTFVIVRVTSQERRDINHPECTTRAQAEMLLSLPKYLADMDGWHVYLTIEERWSLKGKEFKGILPDDPKEDIDGRYHNL